MGKYIRMAKPYLVLVTVFVLVRFFVEWIGPEYIGYRDFELKLESVASEISLTRLLFVLPVFFGLRFVRESLGSWKEMVVVNTTYAFWGMILVIIVHFLDDTFALGTHYGRGAFGPVALGTVISWAGWQMHGAAPVEPPNLTPGFCASMLLMLIATNVVCFVTIQLSKRIGIAQGISE